ncbi:hypothetical protein K2Q16_03025 [Patescibacteria group bacterium]|nr:hypothetical protein [Patescibacteria group bacterium]
MKPKTLVSYITPSTITATLLFAIGCCVVLYIYFVAASVLHVVVKQDVDVRSSAVRSELASLETSLIAAQHEISNRLALSNGYNEEDDKVFIRRGESDDVALRTNPSNQ